MGVVAKIIEIEESGTNENIVVWVNFKVDGVDFVTIDKQGNPNIRNGINVWGFHTRAERLAGKTNQQIKDWLRLNVETQCNNLILARFKQNANATLIADKMSAAIGYELTVEEAVLELDSNFDGTVDTRWTVKTDGTYIEEII